MTMIPNCRAEYTKQAFPLGERFRKLEDIPDDEKSPYFEGNLNEENSRFIEGYDLGVATVINYISNQSPDGEFVELVVPQVGQIGMMDMFDRLNNEPGRKVFNKELFMKLVKDFSPAVQAFAALWVDAMCNAEDTRNEIITGMIEGQEEKDNE